MEKSAKVEIAFLSGECRGKKIVVSDGIDLGSGPEMDVALSRDPRISPHHVRITKDRILDMGSEYGTYVNGRMIKEGPISPGDVVTIGSTTFKVVSATKGERFSLSFVLGSDVFFAGMASGASLLLVFFLCLVIPIDSFFPKRSPVSSSLEQVRFLFPVNGSYEMSGPYGAKDWKPEGDIQAEIALSSTDAYHGRRFLKIKPQKRAVGKIEIVCEKNVATTPGQGYRFSLMARGKGDGVIGLQAISSEEGHLSSRYEPLCAEWKEISLSFEARSSSIRFSLLFGGKFEEAGCDYLRLFPLERGQVPSDEVSFACPPLLFKVGPRGHLNVLSGQNVLVEQAGLEVLTKEESRILQENLVSSSSRLGPNRIGISGKFWHSREYAAFQQEVVSSGEEVSVGCHFVFSGTPDAKGVSVSFRLPEKVVEDGILVVSGKEEDRHCLPFVETQADEIILSDHLARLVVSFVPKPVWELKMEEGRFFLQATFFLGDARPSCDFEMKFSRYSKYRRKSLEESLAYAKGVSSKRPLESLSICHELIGLYPDYPEVKSAHALKGKIVREISEYFEKGADEREKQASSYEEAPFVEIRAILEPKKQAIPEERRKGMFRFWIARAKEDIGLKRYHTAACTIILLSSLASNEEERAKVEALKAYLKKKESDR